MNTYQKSIQKATSCSVEEACYVEAFMRLDRGVLDALSARQFNALAKSCLVDVRSDAETAKRLADSMGLTPEKVAPTRPVDGVPEGMHRIRWAFDPEGAVYDGLTDGSTWNGFPNVWVTPETHQKVLVDHSEIEDAEGFDELTPCDESTDRVGLFCYGWGFTPTLMPTLKMYRNADETRFYCSDCVARGEHRKDDEKDLIEMTDFEVLSMEEDVCLPTSGPFYCGSCGREAMTGEARDDDEDYYEDGPAPGRSDR